MNKLGPFQVSMDETAIKRWNASPRKFTTEDLITSVLWIKYKDGKVRGFSFAKAFDPDFKHFEVIKGLIALNVKEDTNVSAEEAD